MIGRLLILQCQPHELWRGGSSYLVHFPFQAKLLNEFFGMVIEILCRYGGCAVGSGIIAPSKNTSSGYHVV